MNRVTTTAPAIPLDLAAARRWALASRAGLAEARDQINALNVFPVPDGDTGTNMFLTFDGALDVLRGQPQGGEGQIGLTEGLGLLARGMLLSARGNSGVILSQLARGLHEVATEADGPVHQIGPDLLADTFSRADELAWSAVAAPVEGTILSVSRAAAAAARETAPTAASAVEVSAAVVAASRAALERTPEQLPLLARAGVVDAGGAGLVIVLEALHRILTDGQFGADAPDSPWLRAGDGRPHLAPDCDDGEGAYEVMYLLTDSDPARAQHLRAHLGQLGASVLVAGGPTDWRVHVHLDDPQAAIEAGAMAGHVGQVHTEQLVRRGGMPSAQQEETRPPVGVVACSPGEGWSALFAQAGATVVPSAPGARASTGQLLSAAWAVPAQAVVLLPNDTDTLMAAQAAATAAAEEGLVVRVIPSRAAVQGAAALAVFDPDGALEEVVETMAEAAGATVHAELTTATHDAQTGAGPCRAGQSLGLLDGHIVVVQDDPAAAARALLARLLEEDTELLTVVAGAAVEPAEREAVQQAVESATADHPLLEVHWLEGGQATYAWLFGAE